MVYANDALARMFGYASAAELMSVAGPILYANPRRRQELERLLDEKGQYHNEEVEYQRKDGSRFYRHPTAPSPSRMRVAHRCISMA